MLGLIKVVTTTGVAADDTIEVDTPPAGSEYVLLFANGWHNKAVNCALKWGITQGGHTDWGTSIDVAQLIVVPIGESIEGYSPGQIIINSSTDVSLYGNVGAGKILQITATVLQRPENFEQIIAEWRMLHPGEEVPPDLFDDLATITGYSSTLLATEWNRLFPGETVPDDVYSLLKEKAYYRSALRLLKER
jgi:hypothetical protein